MRTKKKQIRKPIHKVCELCGKEFITKQNRTRYCSRSCGAKAWREIKPKTCPVCNKEFTPYRNNRGKYCSKACMSEGVKKQVQLKCEQCGKQFSRVLSEHLKSLERSNRSFCNKRCSDKWHKHNDIRLREKNPQWKGGKTKDIGGYIMVRQYGEERTKIYKQEHRIVAEEMLGRPLTKDEVVHHINGNKTDNRPENLQVMTKAEHSRLHVLMNGGIGKTKIERGNLK